MLWTLPEAHSFLSLKEMTLTNNTNNDGDFQPKEGWLQPAGRLPNVMFSSRWFIEYPYALFGTRLSGPTRQSRSWRGEHYFDVH
jgi:hypothetical protein